MAIRRVSGGKIQTYEDQRMGLGSFKKNSTPQVYNSGVTDRMGSQRKFTFLGIEEAQIFRCTKDHCKLSIHAAVLDLREPHHVDL